MVEAPDETGRSEWAGLRVRVRHQTVEALGLIAILVQDAVILLAGFLAEFAYERWLHSESRFFGLAVNISSGLFLLLYVITVTVHVVHYVREQVGATSAVVISGWRSAVAGLALFLAGVASAAFLLPRGPLPSPMRLPLPEMRADISVPTTTDPVSFALSPDGKSLVYAVTTNGVTRLWLRSLASTTAQMLAGTDGAMHPFWSPDSRSIGFFAGSQLKRLDVRGGQPQAIAQVTTGRGGTWNADGTILFAIGTLTPIFSVSASGGQVKPVTTLDRGQKSHRFPRFLPDGRRFLFVAEGPQEGQAVYLGSLDGQETRLTPSDGTGTYLEPGWLLWVRSGTLLAQRLDLDRRALVGESIALADGVTFDAYTLATGVSVSDGGAVAYRVGAADRRQLVWFDHTGRAQGTVGPPDENGLGSPRISPDGQRVVVHRNVQGNSDIWLLEGGKSVRLTFDPGNDRYPIWSPDGTRVVFDSGRNGIRDLYTKPVTGGAESLLFKSAQHKSPTDWSGDGRFILFTDQHPDWDIWVLPTDGDGIPKSFLKTGFNEFRAVLSPDGRWVAYQSNESGRYEVYVRPLVDGGPDPAGRQWQLSTDGGIEPAWRRDGKELYYVAPDSTLMAVPVRESRSALEVGSPSPLFPTRIAGGGVEVGLGRQYDVAPDGRFLVNSVPEGDALAQITLLLNWHPPDAKAADIEKHATE